MADMRYAICDRFLDSCHPDKYKVYNLYAARDVIVGVAAERASKR